MKSETDMQMLETAQVLLKQAGVIWMLWTAEDVADMVQAKLAVSGLRFDVEDVMAHIHLTHLSNDDTEESIWLCVDAAIAAVAENKLGG